MNINMQIITRKSSFIWLLTVVAAFNIVISVQATDIELDDGVLVLNNNNFKEAIENNKYVLVEFYAPWCGHCKALAPEYAKAAEMLAEKSSAIKLAKVDATAESSLAELYQVRGYPTLKFFRNGTPIEYTGSRQAADIVSWVTKKTGPPAKVLANVEEVEAFLQDNPIALIGYFKDQESEEAKIFTDAATDLDAFVFGITSSEEVFTKNEVTDGSVILYKPFDELQSVYSEPMNVENLKKFVQVESLPLISDFNHESAAKIFGGSVKSHLLFFVSKEAGHIDKYVEPLKDLAKQYRNDVLFVTISSDEEDHARIFEFFGMTKDEVPTVRLIKLEEDMAKYKPDVNDLSPDTIKDFLQKFMEGKLKQHLLSQELPDDWDKNPVKVLVASNFDDVVFDKTKDVLVEFYAPWCGHCKQLAPIYEQLAEKFKKNDTIVIAKMDATANELEHTKISSFPTIKFYRKGDNSVVDYYLDRSLDDFVKFIESGGTAAPTPVVEEQQAEESADDSHQKDEL